jgi:hypothetical protein
VRNDRSAGPQRWPQRALDLFFDFVRRVFPIRARPDGAADVVDQHVDSAVGRDCSRCDLLRAVPGFKIAERNLGLSAGGADFVAHSLGLRRGAVGDDHLRALGGQAPRGGAADALRGAGDHRRQALETAAVVGVVGHGGLLRCTAKRGGWDRAREYASRRRRGKAFALWVRGAGRYH